MALRPSLGEFRRCLAGLLRVFGERDTASLLGVSVVTLRTWRRCRSIPDAAAVRCVWLIHALTLRPGLVTSAFDLVTWGRFKVQRPVLPPEDWSI